MSAWWERFKARRAVRKQQEEQEYKSKYINVAIEALMDLEPSEAFEAIQKYTKRITENAKKVLAYQKQIKEFTGDE